MNSFTREEYNLLAAEVHLFYNCNKEEEGESGFSTFNILEGILGDVETVETGPNEYSFSDEALSRFIDFVQILDTKDSLEMYPFDKIHIMVRDFMRKPLREMPIYIVAMKSTEEWQTILARWRMKIRK